MGAFRWPGARQRQRLRDLARAPHRRHRRADPRHAAARAAAAGRALRARDDVHRRWPGLGGDLRERAGGVSATGPGEQTLREVVEALAPLERGAGSSGERQAAEWLAARLTAAGCPAEVEPVQFLDGYARLMSALAGAS